MVNGGDYLRISLSYPESEFIIPDKNLIEVIEPKITNEDEHEIIANALENPIGCARLNQIVNEKSRVLILVDDNTRNTPADKILSILLCELHERIKDKNRIQFLVAGGTHRPMTCEEKIKKLGQYVIDQYVIYDHDAYDESSLVPIGKTSAGIPIQVNKLLLDFDIKIGLGHIVPHRNVGFSGGSKIIQPGVCGADTTGKLHWESILVPNKKMLGNPDNIFRKQAEEIGSYAGHMKKLYGVTVAMITPMGENGEILTEAIKKHVDFLIEKGVHCLYPLGTTGEMYLLTVDERKKAAETVVKQADGRVTTYIHVGAMRAQDTIELAKHAFQIGADGIGVITPSFFMVNDREMEEYYVSVANSVPEDFPVYLYNIPQRSGNDLKPEVIERILKRTSNVVGIKYSWADMARTREYLKINNWNFSVLHGADNLITSIMAIGCDGTVSGCSSVFPEYFVAVYEAFKRGDMEEAQRLQNIAADIANVLKGGTNMGYFKAALKMRGIDVGHMRAPLLDITEEEYAAFYESVKKYL